MIKNYFIIALRNLLRNKLYSFINIAGLAIGISCCVLIYLYVQNELSYDTFNEKSDNIYRLTLDVHQPKEDIKCAATAPLMGPLIQDNFPEIKTIVRLGMPLERYIGYKDKKLYDNKIASSDSTFFDVFTLPMLEGDPKKALAGPYKIVLTESMAKKYFGNESALGKIMEYNNNTNVTVTGVVKDVPKNSHFDFDALLSRTTQLDLVKNDTIWMRDRENNWYWTWQYTYFLIEKNTNIKLLESKISALTEKQCPERRADSHLWYSGKLQPLRDIHLKSAMDREIKPNGDIKYVYIFSGTALLILLIAGFNFINLSTARSVDRSKEIGLRKVIGASRYQLIQQFLGESLLFSFIASLFSIITVILILPYFNLFAGVDLTLDSKIIWIYVMIILIVGLFSGLYPAFLISSFKPIKALKGYVRHGWQDIFFRKGLVVFQFSIAVIMIIGTQIILQQLHFVQNMKMGIQKDQMLQLNFKKANKTKQESFLKELEGNPNIISASLNSFSFKSIPNIHMAINDDGEFNAQYAILIDENFINTFQLNIIEGRNVSKAFPTDENEAFLINETAVKSFGWKTPKLAIGKKINWAGEKFGKVVGVVKDFNYTSLHEELKPLVMHIFPGMRNSITIRINAKNTQDAISSIENKWKNMFPGIPFNYTFMQDDFDAMYKGEQKLSNVIGTFTGLSIFVSCLGLFGLAAFSIKQRVKEIGIRKVLGASVQNITSIVSKDFMKLVFISIVISSPIAWFVCNKWLQDFAYRINISWWIFILSGALAIIIALATVSSQAIKAAIANPIKSLRTE